MYNILIVDDSPELLELFSLILKKYNCRCSIAASKTELLQHLKNEIPDIILLDVMLPGQDGRSICKELKLMKQYSSIPVILLSASTEKLKNHEEVFADDILEKPFTIEIVFQKINSLVSYNNSLLNINVVNDKSHC